MSVRSTGRLPLASTTDAQAGTRNDVYMTPASTAAEIAALSVNNSSTTIVRSQTSLLTRGKAIALSRQ